MDNSTFYSFLENRLQCIGVLTNLDSKVTQSIDKIRTFATVQISRFKFKNGHNGKRIF
jgi:hypothetical protein